MIEHIERRALALLLAVLMVFTMVPVQASAAGTRTETASIGNLGISVSIPTENGGGSDLGSFSLNGTTIGASAQAEATTDDCTGITSYNEMQTIITFTNNTSGEAIIRFDFTVNGGKLEVGSVEQATSGSYTSASIAAGGTLQVKLYSPDSGANKVGDSSNMTLTNVELIENKAVTLVFKPGTNGSVSVKGAAISADTTVNTNYIDGVAIAATAASGYKFLAWVDADNTVVSTVANTTLHPTRDMTVSAYFVPSSTNGYWLAGGKIHTDLEAAITAAQAADGMVRLLDSTTLSKSVTIPAGVTVLIPCNADMVAYGENPIAIARPDGTLPAPAPFRTLTMADGVVLTVNGSLELAAKHYVAHGARNDGGRVIDYYGYIQMGANTRIDVQSGGKLFAWGYITGSGKVNAYSGATVYEKFQISDYRGGGITSIIVPAGVFPFNQYYVQNVEVPESIHAGASLVCHAGIYGSEVITSSIQFIGSSGSMFTLGDGAVATKRYDAATDRLIIDVDGQVGLNSISLMDYNTANFILPINHNITVNINSGMTTINQDVMLQPGTVVNVDRDAYLVIATGKKVYLMDADNWGNYCFGATMKPIYYTVANGTTVKRSTLSDAKINLNGTAAVQGQLYASAAGALIPSEGKTGVVVLMNSAPSSTTNIKQSTAIQSGFTGMTTNISVGAALLTNADGTTVNTSGAAQYTTYVYDTILDKWVTTAISITPTLTYNANGGNGADLSRGINFQSTALSFQPLSVAVESADTFTREDYVFTGWNTAADGSGKSFAPGDYITISQNHTLYAQWRKSSATVSFVANAPEGTEAQGQMSSQTLVLDENGNSEFEVPDCGYTVEGYTFDGWLGSDGNTYVVGQVYTVTGDLTLTAQWTKSSAVITFNANAPAGTTASGAMAEQFALEGDKLNANGFSVTGYTFTGWNTKADGSGVSYADGAAAPTENTTLYAQWKINTYTITWIIDGKSETTTVNHGQVPTHADPTKAETAEYTYEFTGWTPAVVAATGNATYTAQFEATAKSYTITYMVDGTAVHTDTFAFGAAVTAWNYTAPEGYNFSGWNEEIPATMPAENVTISGTTSIKTYTITWVIDGKTETTTVNHGQVPTHADPTKAETAEYTYEFTGWTPAVVKATRDATYTAQFEATAKSYTITYVVDGTAVHTDTFAFGAAVTAWNYTAPEGYNFSGWNEEIPATMPAENVTISGTTSIKTYTITWVIDGESETVTVNHGQVPTHDDPVKADANGYKYTFAGWTPAVVAATGDATYTAQFNQTRITYTVSFDTDGDGDIDVSKTVAHGDVPEAPDFALTDNAEWDYTFTGWRDSDGNVHTTLPAATGAAVYTAAYTAVKQNYTITWDIDGKKETTTVAYGEMPTHADPTKAETAEYTYEFIGWTPALTAVTGDATYTAQFEATAKSYTITYVVDGNEVHFDTYAFGAAVTAWNYTAPEGYNFSGWNEEIPATMPAENVTITGTTSIKIYTITWKDDEGNTLGTTTVNHGDLPTYADPSKAETAQYTYTFAGWTPSVVAATGDATYTATFTPVLRSYDITFVVDGQEDKVVSTKYGETPVYDADGKVPEKATDAKYSYTFAGWTPSLEAVTGEATYTATWTETPVQHTIIFKEGDEILGVITGDYGTAVDMTEVPVTDRTGYTFNGWSAEIPATIPAEDLVITGSWTINQYTITFKDAPNNAIDDEFAGYTITKNFGEAITAEDIAALNAALPTITGCEFSYWRYEDAELDGGWAAYEIPDTMPAKDMVVYASWNYIEYEMNIFSGLNPDTLLRTVYNVYKEYYLDIQQFFDINSVNFTDPDGENYLTPEGYTFTGFTYADGSEVLFTYSQPAHNVDIYAQFAPIDYTVTFMNGDIKYAEVTAGYGTAITLPENPTKEGYTFAGWVDAEGVPVNLTTMPLNGMTVFASWTVDTFKMIFYGHALDPKPCYVAEIPYGTVLDTEYVETLMALAGEPELLGHFWEGWDLHMFPETMPAENVTIYGTWTVRRYQLTWEVYDELEDEVIDTFSSYVLFRDLVEAPDYRAPEGYYVSNVEGVPCEMPANDLTLRLTVSPETYQITFDSCGGTPVDRISAPYKSAVTAPAAPTKTGHTFLGWSIDGETVIDFPETMPLYGMDLKALWAKNTVFITFVIEGVETVKEFSYGDPIVAPEATKAPDAKWTYKFISWDADLPATATEDATFTAQFAEDEAIKYTVKFVDGETVVFETKIAWNDVVTLDCFTAPEIIGKTLAWTVDGAEAAFPYAMTTADVTFVASWTPITYTVYYYTVDGFDNNEGPVYTAQATYGAAFPAYTLTLPEGYDFGFWAEPNGTAYHELPETMPAQDLHLIGYTTPKTFTVTWYYGVGEMLEETYAYGATVNGFIPERFYVNTETHRGWFDHDWWYNQDTNEHVDITFTMPAENLSICSATKFTGWMGGPNQSFFNYFADYMGQQGWFCVNDKNELVTDGSGEWYYAGADVNVVSDITEIEGVYYAFDHNTGAFLGDYTGIYEARSGDKYYVENGIAVKNKGLVKDVLADGHIHYYYFGCADATCDDAACGGEYKAQRGIGHWTEITNGYLVLWGYQFDENGVIIHDEDTSKNGVHLDNGVKFYYIDGVKVHKGLFIGDDNEYYYAKSDGSLVVDRDYWISESHINGLTYNGEPIVEGSYTFDAEGRIVWPNTEKNGVYMEDGKLYYYEAGLRTYAGLIRYTGSLYNENGTAVEGVYNNDIIYVRGTGELAVGKYWPTKTNGLKDSDTYQFDEYGRMMKLNGIIAEDGSLYYYVDGLRNYAGLIEIDGSLYYVRGTGEVVNGRSYWITKTNGLEDEGTYEFAADGKMIIPEPVAVKNGIYRENGKLYYYVDGKLDYAGLKQYTGNLTEEDGTVIEGVYNNAYIYVRGTGELAVGSYWTTKHNGLMKSATHQFDEYGIMTDPAV